MSDIVIFDEATNRVKRYMKSVNTPEYAGRTDVVIFDKSNPPSTLDPLLSIDRKYWKHDNGSIVEMNQGEKDTLDAELELKGLTDARNSADKDLDNRRQGMLIRAFMLVTMDRFNAIKSPSDPTLTKAMLRTAIKNKIQSGDAD